MIGSTKRRKYSFHYKRSEKNLEENKAQLFSFGGRSDVHNLMWEFHFKQKDPEKMTRKSHLFSFFLFSQNLNLNIRVAIGILFNQWSVLNQPRMIYFTLPTSFF